MQSDYLFFEGTATRPARPLTSGPALRPVSRVEESNAELGTFFTTLLQLVDLPATHYRARSLARRSASCLRLLKAKTPEEAVQKLHSKPELAQTALDCVLLGVTDFFRDRVVFEQLRFTILPQLLARDTRLRIWSAACSEGHELYSVAMLLAEEGRVNDCELLGTDCRAQAILQARLGLFEAANVAKLDSHWRRNFFVTDAITARIDPALVAATCWKRADLFSGSEPGPWDMILWRNMAIYLEAVAADQIWRSLCHELSPGGFLITGKADHPPAGLPLTRIATCIYQKTSLPCSRTTNAQS